MTGSTSGAFPRPILEAALEAGGFRLPPGAAEALVLHAGEMLRWNPSIRLTAITDPREVAVKHVLDSLLLLRFGPFSGKILDVGSGAGYPGIPLAICLPDCRVTLVEAVGKKCAFLSRSAALISLDNVEVIHGRIERKGGVAPGPFESVVSRATFPPEEAVARLAPHVGPGGRLLLMTGPAAEPGGAPGEGRLPEALPLPPGWSPGRIEVVILPYNMGTRRIIELVAG